MTRYVEMYGQHGGQLTANERDERERQRRSVRVAEPRLVARLGPVTCLARHRADVDDDSNE